MLVIAVLFSNADPPMYLTDLPSIVSGMTTSFAPVYPVMVTYPLPSTEYSKPSGLAAPFTSKIESDEIIAIMTIRDTDAKHIFFHIRIN